MTQRRRNAGFALREVAVVLMLLTSAFAVFLFLAKGGCGMAGNAPGEARKFAESTGEPFNAINCMTVDSDGDGYVSCSIFRPGKDPLAVECARRFTLNTGCRVAIMKGGR